MCCMATTPLPTRPFRGQGRHRRAPLDVRTPDPWQPARPRPLIDVLGRSGGWDLETSAEGRALWRVFRPWTDLSTRLNAGKGRGGRKRGTAPFASFGHRGARIDLARYPSISRSGATQGVRSSDIAGGLDFPEIWGMIIRGGRPCVELAEGCRRRQGDIRALRRANPGALRSVVPKTNSHSGEPGYLEPGRRTPGR